MERARWEGEGAGTAACPSKITAYNRSRLTGRLPQSAEDDLNGSSFAGSAAQRQTVVQFLLLLSFFFVASSVFFISLFFRGVAPALSGKPRS